jgi:two-component system CheB/CheR fusion protein
MKSDAPFPVVGIGASAGGLRALEDFFKAVPDDSGMAFVVITHLAPDRASFLTDILARHTGTAVEAACDDKKVEPNRIYVLPPNASLTIADGRLRLRETEPSSHERNPIDVFFSSLALDCGERAVGVILSGSGHDGVLGVKAIKEQGGLVLAQAEGPSGPGFPGMPDSAIASGLVDFAIPLEAMAEKLAENARNLDVVDILARKQLKGDDDRANSDAREAIYAVLRAQTGHDFSGYKTRTFIRRVQRRMQVHHCEALADYARLLQRKPEEATALFRDLLYQGPSCLTR